MHNISNLEHKPESTFAQFITTLTPSTSLVEEWSILMTVSVCLSVCLSARITQKPHVRSSANFCACCLWLWLGPVVSASRYVMYFRFCGWRHVCA